MTVDEKGLADEIEREMMTWRGANGGVYTIRACAFAIAQRMASRLLSARSAEPVAWMHVMTYETGETNEQLSFDEENPFGEPGKDYSAEYPVESIPLYDHHTPEAPMSEIGEESAKPVARRVRHRRRGTIYEVVGRAKAQVSVDADGRPFGLGVVRQRPLIEGFSVTVYREVESGSLWCRFPDEFEDGRFEDAD